MSEREEIKKLVADLNAALKHCIQDLQSLDRLLDRLEVGRPPANWKQEPATMAQTEFLKRYEIPFSMGITKGEAHTLIERKIDEWKGKR